jgi:CheY-like chemotaxis protein
VVWDTGIGIDPADFDQAFDPFVQLDGGLNRQAQGTGLGLALVKRLVGLHGGLINLDSSPNQGTRFTVSLPLAETAEAAPAPDLPASEAPPDNDPPAEPDGPLILVAEDNEYNVISLHYFLLSQGYRVHVAQDGRACVDDTLSLRPAIVLMDIQMPEMDGLEAIHLIRANPELADLPIIALTALAMPGDRERCLAAGANEYLSKPVSLAKLAETIRLLLEQTTLITEKS